MTKTKAERWTRSTPRTRHIFAGTNVHAYQSTLVKHPLAARFAPIVLAALAAGAAPVVAQDTSHKTGEAWQIVPLPQSSLVFARDGSPIGEIGREMRTNVAIRSLPK